MAGDTSIDMMINVLPGTLTGIFALNAGLSSINQQFQNMTKAVDNHFGIVDAAIVSATALATQFGLKAADAFGQYEQGMKIVQAVSNQSAASIAELGQKASEFSVQYRMDIDELTTGLQTLGRAGLKSAQEQTEVLENGLQTAKLEGRDLNSVLEELIQNTALLGGDLKSSDFGEQTKYVNDLSVATSMTAPITTHDVSETLKYSGGIAAAAGANIETEEGKKLLEDYMASIAAFAQKGVKGSIAGTALRAFFNKPATQDSSVLEGLGMIGLKPEYLWEDDQQTMKPVSEQISLIQSQMDKKGISQMDRLQIWSKIVGGKMGQQMMKLDGGEIKELTKDIQEANSAENLATQSMQTYQSAVKQTGEAGQQAFRAFGEHIARFLTPIAKMLTPILQAMANPVISTTVFTGFIALIGNAWKSVQKIFSSLRLEIGMVKSLMSSTILNQDTRKGIVGNRPWGSGGFADERVAVEQIATRVKETNASSNASSSEVVAKLEEIRRIVTAVNNRIKEVLLEIQGQLSTGISTYSQKINQAITATGGKIKTEFGSSLTQAANSFGTKMSQVVSSSATKMKTEFQLAMNALTYTPKIAQSGAGTVGGIYGMHRDTQSPSYFFTGKLEQQAKEIESKYQSQMTNLEQRKSPMVLAATTSSQEKTASMKLAQLEEESQQLASVLKANSNKLKELETSLTEANATEKEQIELQITNLKEKQALLFEEYELKDEEILIQEQLVMSLKGLVQQINAERLSLATGKGSTVKGGSGILPGVVPVGFYPSTMSDEYMSRNQYGYRGYGYYATPGSMPAVMGNFNWNNVPLQYHPNYAITGVTHTPWNFGAGYSRYNLPPLRDRDIYRIFQSQFGSSAYPAAAMMAAQNPIRTGGSFYQGEAVSTRLANSAVAINSTTNKVNADLIALDLAVRRTTAHLDSYSMSMIKGKPVNNIFAPANLAATEANYQQQVLANHGVAPNRYTDGAATLREESRNNLRNLNRGLNHDYVPMGMMPKDVSERTSQSIAGTITQQNKDAMLNNVHEMDAATRAQIRTLSVAGGTAGYGDRLRNTLWDKRFYSSTNFGKSAARAFTEKGLSNISKGFKGLGSSLSSVTNIMGGPFFAAIMAIDIAMQIWNSKQQEYNKKLEETTKKMDDMLQKQSEAEDIFYHGKHEEGEREIQGWDDENPDADYETRQQALLDAYGSIYDNRSKGLSKLDENTQQLAIATEELKRATETAGKVYTDGSFFSGTGMFQHMNDLYEGTPNKEKDWWAILTTSALSGGAWMASTGLNMSGVFGSKQYDDKFGNTLSAGKESYFENTEVVLTGQQKNENYPWLKEFGPILASDVWKTGTTKSGLKVMLGDDGYNKLNDQLSSTGGWDDTAWIRHGYNVANYFGTNEDQNKLQMGLKMYQKDFSNLAKQMRKYEKSTGLSPLRAFNRQFDKTKNMKKTLKNLSVQDPKLVSYIKSLAIKTGMSEQQVLMAAQLQQLQDMNNIANNQVTPRLMNLVSSSYQQTAYGGQTLSTVSGAGEGAISAAQNAAAIAALLQVKVETELGKQAFAEYTDNLKGEKGKYETPEQLMAAAKNAHNLDVQGKLPEKQRYLLGYYDNYMESYARVNAQVLSPGRTQEQIDKFASDFMKGSKESQATSSAMLDTLRKGLNTGVTQEILAAYDASLDEQDDGGSGGGSGSGKGSNKDKDTGTKKERVDLVLCNKKEIPKLNVNLFKKAPSFTILNKNFKLRDIKVNTQDKPKAVLASIKNAIIDVQKRTDPKIIQDEEAIYDPVGATDGNTPSGTSDVRTNTG